jgi:spermidine/putrescine transport system substrate-binding protein
MRYLLTGLLFFSFAVFSESHVLNLYSWDGYTPQSVLNAFEKETGIHVNLTEYDSNETLYAKLKANPHAGYDVIVPSSYFVSRMRKQGMLRKLDRAQLTHINNLNPALLNQSYDPHNRYSLPYLWGTTAMVFDQRYWNPRKIHRWSDLWHRQFKNKLLMYNDAREVFAVALMTLGYSINDKNPQHIKQAYLRLKKLMANIRLFNTGAANSIYADGDITIGMAENGDALMAKQYNPYLVYIYPREGFAIWVDSIAIPRYAPHYQNALKFINFIMRPNIAKTISLGENFSTPNHSALKLFTPHYRNNPTFNPGKKILKYGQFEQDVGSATTLYQHYWQLLKL